MNVLLLQHLQNLFPHLQNYNLAITMLRIVVFVSIFFYRWECRNVEISHGQLDKSSNLVFQP
jgi:hypothetical protein